MLKLKKLDYLNLLIKDFRIFLTYFSKHCLKIRKTSLFVFFSKFSKIDFWSLPCYDLLNSEDIINFCAAPPGVPSNKPAEYEVDQNDGSWDIDRSLRKTVNPSINANIPSLFFVVSSRAGPSGLQQSILADWSSSGPESNANGHGPSSTLPRMSSHSNSHTDQGKRHVLIHSTNTHILM